LLPFTISFVPFGLAISAALLYALTEQNLNLYRARFTIWVSLALVLPALCLYTLGLRNPARWSYWRWFWTFSYLAYLIHFYWSLRAFHYNVEHIYDKQGALVATSNFVLTGLWGLDVVLAWLPVARWRPVQIERFLTTILTCVSFFVAAVLFKTGFVRGLGIAATVIVGACLVFRILDTLLDRAPAEG
jgi:hypothetical protein